MGNRKPRKFAHARLRFIHSRGLFWFHYTLRDLLVLNFATEREAWPKIAKLLNRDVFLLAFPFGNLPTQLMWVLMEFMKR